MAAAVHTVAVALLGSAAIAGTLRFETRRVVRYVVITTVLTVVTIVGLRVTFRTVLRQQFKGEELVYGMTNALEHEPTHVVERSAGTTVTEGPVLDRVRARGTLRVGFVQPRLPFAFHNRLQELVGFDVELAHLLAADMNVQAEFSEFSSGELFDAVTSGVIDIGIGGNPVTPLLATRATFSEPYLDETLAFIVKDHLRSRFETWDSIRQAKDLTIAVPPLPYYQRLLKARLPDLPLKTFDVAMNPLADSSGFDAVVVPAERGSVLTLLHPEWSVVVPQPGVIKVPVAFPLPQSDLGWDSFVNTWIEMKRRDGTLDTLYHHWILGEAATRTTPRWSVIRNVLHWVD